MRVIRAAVIPPRTTKVNRKSKYKQKLLDFKSSGFEYAEVTFDEGEDARKVYMGFAKFAKAVGVRVVKRGERLFLARGDAQ